MCCLLVHWQLQGFLLNHAAMGDASCWLAAVIVVLALLAVNGSCLLPSVCGSDWCVAMVLSCSVCSSSDGASLVRAPLGGGQGWEQLLCLTSPIIGSLEDQEVHFGEQYLQQQQQQQLLLLRGICL